MPTELRFMSGWSGAVFEYLLDPIDEQNMRKLLINTWKLAPETADLIIDQVGCGVRWRRSPMAMNSMTRKLSPGAPSLSIATMCGGRGTASEPSPPPW